MLRRLSLLPGGTSGVEQPYRKEKPPLDDIKKQQLCEIISHSAKPEHKQRDRSRQVKEHHGHSL